MKYRNSSWRTKCSLLPGQRGAKKESREYGDALICVRYRYDEKSNQRIKTIELVVEEKVVPPKVEGVGVKLKRYPCRDFTSHYRAIHTCSNCGWPRQDHRREKEQL